jgi:hypothetical protein
MIHSGACDFPKACGRIPVLWLKIGLIGFHRVSEMETFCIPSGNKKMGQDSNRRQSGPRKKPSQRIATRCRSHASVFVAE